MFIRSYNNEIIMIVSIDNIHLKDDKLLNTY